LILRIKQLLGHFFRAAKIPIGEVVATPVCRAREAAELSLGRVATGSIRVFTARQSSTLLRFCPPVPIGRLPLEFL
jgi:hypothetical protein